MGLQDGNDARALAMLTTRWSEWAVSVESMRGNKVPALAVIGQQDGFLVDTQKLAEMMPSLRIEVIPGDHGTARSQPEFANAIISFLAEVGLLRLQLERAAFGPIQLTDDERQRGDLV